MYFPIAFATLGDQTMVPLTGTELGAINFQFGYGSNYSASITSDPDALLVDRLTFNYMMGAVTSTLQQLYQSGLPPFITSAENQGSAYAYAAGAMTLGPDGKDYYSIVGSNNTIPGTSPSKWFLFNPTYFASKGEIPLAGVTGGTYSFASLGSGCTLTYTVSGGVINAVSSVAAGGTTYAVGDLITPNGGNYDAVIRVTGVSGGVITTVAILYGGTGYIAGTAVATQNANTYKQKITIAGILTSGATFIMPNGPVLTNAAEWIVSNNTTGAFSVTFKISNGSNVATGTGVVITQGSNNSQATIIDTDGTNDFWFTNSRFSPMQQITLTATATATLVNTGYVANGGSLVNIPLPASASDGDIFQVIGLGVGGWAITQAVSQQVIFGNVSTTSGTGGSLASTNRYDNLTLKYVAAATAWMVTASIGNITMV